MQRLEDLASKYNLTRAAAHSLTDRGLAGMHHIIRIISILQPDNMMLYVQRQLKGFERVQSSFSLFESALTAASARIPLSAITDWQHKLRGEVCVICLCETEDDEPSLVLPCGHCFHQPCAERWLHMNSTCPCCRRTLTGEEGRTNPANINTDIPPPPPESKDAPASASTSSRGPEE